MQMLAAGGLPLWTDGVRRADEDNHRGCYDFETVEKTKANASRLAATVDKVVQISRYRSGSAPSRISAH